MKINNVNEMMELIDAATEEEIAEVAGSLCKEVAELIAPYTFFSLDDIAKIVSRKEERIGKNLAACFKRVGCVSVYELRDFLTDSNGLGKATLRDIATIVDNIIMDVWAPECAAMRESGLYPDDVIDAVDDLMVMLGNNLAVWSHEAAEMRTSLIEVILRKENMEEIAAILEAAEEALRVMYDYGISAKRFSIFQAM